MRGPGDHAITSNVLVAMLFREGGEALKKDALAPELEAQGVVQIYVKSDVLAQHHASPGQGCAICCSAAISTLA